MFRVVSLVDIQSRMKLKAQANGLLMSYMWWVVEPLLYAALFFIVFVFLLESGSVNFFGFLLCGLFPYLWFTKAVSSGSVAIWENRGLLAQKDMPKWIFPLVNVHETFYKQLWAFGVMLLALIVSEYSPNFKWLQLILIVVLQSYLHFAIALLFSIFICMARDFIVLLDFIFTAVLFGSGVFWDVNTIESKLATDLIMQLNPVAVIINMYRDVLLRNQMLVLSDCLSVFVWSTCILFIAVILMGLFRKQMSRRLFS